MVVTGAQQTCRAESQRLVFRGGVSGMGVARCWSTLQIGVAMRRAGFVSLIAVLVGFALFNGCKDESPQGIPDAALRGCARCKTDEVCVEYITDCCGCA